MIKSPKHIEIVRSTVRGLSSMSQESCDAAFGVLSKYYSDIKITFIDNIEDLDHLVLRKPDLVFLGMEFLPVNPILGSRDLNRIWLSAYLDKADIAYTGSAQAAHALQRDKSHAKQRVLNSGLKTSGYYVIKQNQIVNKKDIKLRYPLFVKPKDRGGGLGIDSYSTVYNFEQLVSKIRSITSILRSDSIIEQYLPGREFSVAILKDEDTSDFNVMPIELVAPKDRNGIRILSDKVKTANSEEVVEVSESEVRNKVNQLAINVFYALGARDYGRIDIRLDEDGEPNFLEANLIPSLISGYGSFPKACLVNKNIDYESMIINITNLGLKRINDNKSKKSSKLIEKLVTLPPLLTKV